VRLRARDPLQAEVRAVEHVRAEWEGSFYAFRNRGAPPYLTINAIGLLSFWHRLLGAPQDYIFYSAEGVQMPPPAHLRRGRRR
jgi:hypothetical protein